VAVTIVRSIHLTALPPGMAEIGSIAAAHITIVCADCERRHRHRRGTMVLRIQPQRTNSLLIGKRTGKFLRRADKITVESNKTHVLCAGYKEFPVSGSREFPGGEQGSWVRIFACIRDVAAAATAMTII
jgi:hypothetical protein